MIGVKIKQSDNIIDPYLAEKLIKEKDGVFMWSLFGLERVIKNKGFDIPKVVQEESEEFMKTLNPVLLFVEEQGRLGPDERTGTIEMYDEYKKWCSDGGNRPLSRNKFQDQVLMNNPMVTKSRIGPERKRKRGFIGIGLKQHII